MNIKERIHNMLQIFKSSIFPETQIGGWCGCCGKWVDNVNVEKRWPWCVCETCRKI